ncbi:MAG: hypothetical protein U1E34_02200 [Amaricoccus sp.]
MKRALLAAAAALAATCTALGAPRPAAPNAALDPPSACKADESGLGWDFVGVAGTGPALVIARTAPSLCPPLPDTARALRRALRGLWSGVTQAWAAVAETEPAVQAARSEI